MKLGTLLYTDQHYNGLVQSLYTRVREDQFPSLGREVAYRIFSSETTFRETFILNGGGTLETFDDGTKILLDVVATTTDQCLLFGLRFSGVRKTLNQFLSELGISKTERERLNNYPHFYYEPDEVGQLPLDI